ncbi:hypothetical protein PoB_007428000 [Plakobranchus ocellatus]|uniref:Uncharacterized protein n=1 Tax=Plakobranchus ocellatus TaxID=259542 RepID=A0AAV4DUP9_9GAST|nr:hypothetical protein PoB_007428000 [Plakobranchus ocellatus]
MYCISPCHFDGLIDRRHAQPNIIADRKRNRFLFPTCPAHHNRWHPNQTVCQREWEGFWESQCRDPTVYRLQGRLTISITEGGIGLPGHDVAMTLAHRVALDSPVLGLADDGER